MIIDKFDTMYIFFNNKGGLNTSMQIKIGMANGYSLQQKQCNQCFVKKARLWIYASQSVEKHTPLHKTIDSGLCYL